MCTAGRTAVDARGHDGCGDSRGPGRLGWRRGVRHRRILAPRAIRRRRGRRHRRRPGQGPGPATVRLQEHRAPPGSWGHRRMAGRRWPAAWLAMVFGMQPGIIGVGRMESAVGGEADGPGAVVADGRDGARLAAMAVRRGGPSAGVLAAAPRSPSDDGGVADTGARPPRSVDVMPAPAGALGGIRTPMASRRPGSGANAATASPARPTSTST